MRKFLFIFVIVFSFTLTGCAEDPNVTRFDTSDSTTSDDQEATDNTQETTEESTTDNTLEETINQSNEAPEKTEESTKPQLEEPKAEPNPEISDAEPVLVEDAIIEKNASEETVEKTEEAPAIPTEESSIPKSQLSKTGDLTVTSFTGNHLDTKMSYNLIRGTAPKETHSITINNFKLQKYFSGQTAWSYIASTNFKTLKKGENNYVVKALDKDGKEIDSFTFTITYGDVDSHVLPNVGQNIWLTILLTLGFIGAIKTTKRFKWQ